VCVCVCVCVLELALDAVKPTSRERWNGLAVSEPYACSETDFSARIEVTGGGTLFARHVGWSKNVFARELFLRFFWLTIQAFHIFAFHPPILFGVRWQRGATYVVETLDTFSVGQIFQHLSLGIR